MTKIHVHGAGAALAMLVSCGLAGCSPGSNAEPGGADAGAPNDAARVDDASGADSSTPREASTPNDAGAADGGPTGLAAPPPRPSGAPSGERHVFAVRRVYLGDTERFDGTTFPKTATAWQRFGYDLDGRDTTSATTATCSPRQGTGVLDAPRGVDNAFGARVLPEIQRYFVSFSVPSVGVSSALERGTDGYLFDVTGLSAETAQTASGLRIDFLGAGGAEYEAGSSPAWDGRDRWKVIDDALVDGTLAGGAKVRFSDAYVNRGTIVSGSPRDFRFTMRLRSAVASAPAVDVSFLLRDAFITARHVPRQGTSPARLDDGIIAGRVRRNDLIETIYSVLAAQNQCSAAALVAPLLDPSFDLIAPGLPATRECDELSMAIGFDAVESAAPTTVVPAVPFVPQTCTPTN